MKQRILSLLLPLLAVLVWTSCSKSVAPTLGAVHGVVQDGQSGVNLAGVNVSLSPSTRSANTGADGKYLFTDLEPQRYTVTATKSGYTTDRREVDILAGQTVSVDFQLMPVAGHLSISKTALNFNPSITQQTFSISNTGQGPLHWHLTEDAPWLTVAPGAGTLQSGQSNTVTVSVDRTGMDQGDYVHAIAVASDGGNAEVNVTMTVAGIMVKAEPEALDFGPVNTAMDLTLTNLGTGSITYALSADREWIYLDKRSGTFKTNDVVRVSVDRSKVSPGNTYSGSLTVTVGADRLTVPVTMQNPARSKPIVNLTGAERTAATEALLKGGIISVGSAEVSQYGFVWAPAENPTFENHEGHHYYGNTAKPLDFQATATQLTPGKRYYFRAFATNAEGTSYSEQRFIDMPAPASLATVVTGEVSEIRSSSAKAQGRVTHLGNVEQVTQHGHVWATVPEPDIRNHACTKLGVRTSNAPYESLLTGLAPGTIYYVRAYATNSVGTAYGEAVQFQTELADIVMQTGSVNNITHKAATCTGAITSTGGHHIVEIGICWGTAANPTISSHKQPAPNVEATFSVNLTGLAEQTTYHVRAYAINDRGIVFYGSDRAFSTTAKGVKFDINDYDDEDYWQP